ncbi:hypothetical protein BJ085DRAFT_13592, partial [Dimargaris cristalligena]
CPCDTGHTSQNHLPKCPLIPHPLLNALPSPQQIITPLILPSPPYQCPPTTPATFRVPLLKILLYIDHICHPDIILPPEVSGLIWSTTIAVNPPVI